MRTASCAYRPGWWQPCGRLADRRATAENLLNVRLLLLSHAFNSLTQRLFVELRQRDHEVSVEFDINDEVTAGAVSCIGPI